MSLGTLVPDNSIIIQYSPKGIIHNTSICLTHYVSPTRHFLTTNYYLVQVAPRYITIIDTYVNMIY